MKALKLLSRVAVCLAVAGLLCPQLALAAPPKNSPKPLISDLKLHQGHMLLGQVVDAQNNGLPKVKVTLGSGRKQLAVGTTDANGYFAFSGLQTSGVYQITAAEGFGVYRVWTSKTAPPSAQQAALIVSGNQIVRGQAFARGMRDALANPWIVGSLVAAAIAIPVAVHNADRRPSSP